MKGYSTHYSYALNPSSLRRASYEAAESIMDVAAAQNRIPLLIFTGMSGTAFATAISMALTELDHSFKYKMAYIRKAEEKSHGQPIEHNIYECRYGADYKYHDNDWQKNQHRYLPIFVDDVIDTGATLLYISEAVARYFAPLKVGHYVLSCTSENSVGVEAVVYNSDGSVELAPPRWNAPAGVNRGTVETI